MSNSRLNSTVGKGFNELRVYYQRERNKRGERSEFDRFPSVRVDFPDGTNVSLGTDATTRKATRDSGPSMKSSISTSAMGRCTIAR